MLQQALNEHPTLRTAITSMMDAVADGLEASDDPTGQFKDVRAQLNARVDFRMLFARAILQSADDTQGAASHSMGRALIESFATLLLSDQ